MKDIFFVYNPRSGSAYQLTALKRACSTAGVPVKEFIPIANDMAKKLRRPISEGATIAVLGGDGTMNTLANLLVNTKAVMAPLMGGTFNHFTKDLGVPQRLDEALAKLSAAKIQKIDTVSVNGVYFVNNSMLGLYPQSLQIRSTLQKRYGKWPAAVVAVVRTIVKFHTYYISIDGKDYRTPYVFIGNNHFGLERLGLPGRKKFDGAEMSVYVAHARSRWSIMKLTFMAAIGKLKEAGEFDILAVDQEFTVQTKRKKMRVSHDGELSHMRTPLVYKLHPKSLQILC